ncbi:MAG: hypothetical protein A2Y84_01555 [Candidatus Colwellbacteria bacterium RBG_13_48_8]|uniref:Uncharacterized protein n=1 Tax=Candidatus Colwellbacteria bacterium RBG_13_48_8 TaxID=1797685 RepID=A0A1G1YWH4_9BACT|nr:MAG: hypothetical protein A2Y84_01555 [Candidatus Colwellbacteria bacterium RBG_13_48_8]
MYVHIRYATKEFRMQLYLTNQQAERVAAISSLCSNDRDSPRAAVYLAWRPEGEKVVFSVSAIGDYVAAFRSQVVDGKPSGEEKRLYRGGVAVHGESFKNALARGGVGPGPNIVLQTSPGGITIGTDISGRSTSTARITAKKLWYPQATKLLARFRGQPDGGLIIRPGQLAQALEALGPSPQYHTDERDICFLLPLADHRQPWGFRELTKEGEGSFGVLIQPVLLSS